MTLVGRALKLTAEHVSFTPALTDSVIAVLTHHVIRLANTVVLQLTAVIPGLTRNP
jgi:hypothetical protein